MGNLVRALVVVFSILIVSGTLFVAISVPSTQDFFGMAFGMSIWAFVVFLFWNYRQIEISLSTKELKVRYGLFNEKLIELNNIIFCGSIKASFGRYMGIGVRWGIDGSQAYTTSFGDAVKIILSTGDVFVFSSQSTNKICSLINNQKETL